MALSSAEVAKIAATTITNYERNQPQDQINVTRPLLDALLQNPEDLSGGLDGFALNIFKSNDANGQVYSGNARVTYNSRSPNSLAKFNWLNHHDGFVLSEDELKRNGITIDDETGKKSTATKSESFALANLMDSNMRALSEGVKDDLHSIFWSGTALAKVQTEP